VEETTSCSFALLGLLLCACSDGSEGPPPPPAFIGPVSGAVATALPTGTTTADRLPPPPAPNGSVESPPPSLDEDSRWQCDPPALASYGALEDNPKLPDPFARLDGTRVERKGDWTCQRADLAAEVEAYELGQKPPRPANVAGELEGDTLTVTAGDDTQSISFTAKITLPSQGKAP